MSVHGPDHTILDVISERKQAEEALRRSEEHLRLAIEATGGGTYAYDSATKEGYWPPELKSLIGLGPDDPFPLDADNVPLAVHPEDRTAFLTAMAASIDPRGGGLLRLEFRVFRPDQSVRWLQVIGRTEFTGEGGDRRPRLRRRHCHRRHRSQAAARRGGAAGAAIEILFPRRHGRTCPLGQGPAVCPDQ